MRENSPGRTNYGKKSKQFMKEGELSSSTHNGKDGTNSNGLISASKKSEPLNDAKIEEKDLERCGNLKENRMEIQADTKEQNTPKEAIEGYHNNDGKNFNQLYSEKNSEKFRSTCKAVGKNNPHYDDNDASVRAKYSKVKSGKNQRNSTHFNTNESHHQERRASCCSENNKENIKNSKRAGTQNEADDEPVRRTCDPRIANNESVKRVTMAREKSPEERNFQGSQLCGRSTERHQMKSTLNDKGDLKRETSSYRRKSPGRLIPHNKDDEPVRGSCDPQIDTNENVTRVTMSYREKSPEESHVHGSQQCGRSNKRHSKEANSKKFETNKIQEFIYPLDNKKATKLIRLMDRYTNRKIKSEELDPNPKERKYHLKESKISAGNYLDRQFAARRRSRSRSGCNKSTATEVDTQPQEYSLDTLKIMKTMKVRAYEVKKFDEISMEENIEAKELEITKEGPLEGRKDEEIGNISKCEELKSENAKEKYEENKSENFNGKLEEKKEKRGGQDYPQKCSLSREENARRDSPRRVAHGNEIEKGNIEEIATSRGEVNRSSRVNEITERYSYYGPDTSSKNYVKNSKQFMKEDELPSPVDNKYKGNCAPISSPKKSEPPVDTKNEERHFEKSGNSNRNRMEIHADTPEQNISKEATEGHPDKEEIISKEAAEGQHNNDVNKDQGNLYQRTDSTEYSKSEKIISNTSEITTFQKMKQDNYQKYLEMYGNPEISPRRELRNIRSPDDVEKRTKIPLPITSPRDHLKIDREKGKENTLTGGKRNAALSSRSGDRSKFKVAISGTGKIISTINYQGKEDGTIPQEELNSLRANLKAIQMKPKVNSFGRESQSLDSREKRDLGRANNSIIKERIKLHCEISTTRRNTSNNSVAFRDAYLINAKEKLRGEASLVAGERKTCKVRSSTKESGNINSLKEKQAIQDHEREGISSITIEERNVGQSENNSPKATYALSDTRTQNEAISTNNEDSVKENPRERPSRGLREQSTAFVEAKNSPKESEISSSNRENKSLPTNERESVSSNNDEERKKSQSENNSPENSQTLSNSPTEKNKISSLKNEREVRENHHGREKIPISNIYPQTLVKAEQNSPQYETSSYKRNIGNPKNLFERGEEPKIVNEVPKSGYKFKDQNSPTSFKEIYSLNYVDNDDDEEEQDDQDLTSHYSSAADSNEKEEGLQPTTKVEDIRISPLETSLSEEIRHSPKFSLKLSDPYDISYNNFQATANNSEVLRELRNFISTHQIDTSEGEELTELAIDLFRKLSENRSPEIKPIESRMTPKREPHYPQESESRLQEESNEYTNLSSDLKPPYDDTDEIYGLVYSDDKNMEGHSEQPGGVKKGSSKKNPESEENKQISTVQNDIKFDDSDIHRNDHRGDQYSTVIPQQNLTECSASSWNDSKQLKGILKPFQEKFSNRSGKYTN
ncbi:myb-like protein X [Musca vetustissima]|uniref:myb-like protein X n=1 Tax=Musca vetustissima TaxID=27455 RepID=UPI002AB75CA0|nr:myb-like protein X [Musca vetustissima]